MYHRSRIPGPLGAVAICLTRPLAWGGRASPSEFWWFAGPFLVIQVAALLWLALPPTRVVLWWHAAYTDAEARAALQATLFAPPPFPDISIPIRWMSLDWGLWFFGSILPGLSFIAVTIRRLHDTDHSGWWIWLVLIPGAGLALLVVLLIAPGEIHRNRYGPGRGAAAHGPVTPVMPGVPAVDSAEALRALRESRMRA
jgi:uncharacterized membrane protein YhaH (DUF805 family)